MTDVYVPTVTDPANADISGGITQAEAQKLTEAISGLKTIVTESVALPVESVVSSCPAGLVPCDVAKSRSLGLECPIPQLAGRRFYLITTDGNVCSLQKDLENQNKLSKLGFNVDESIEKIAAALLTEDNDVLAKVLSETKAVAANADIEQEIVDSEATESIQATTADFVELGVKAAKGLASAAKGAYMSLPRVGLLGGSDDIEGGAYDDLVTRLEVDTVKQINAIANFRGQDCPVNYGDRRWIKARGSYAECERRMGFRWVTPSGHCYPEGMCAIDENDIVSKGQATKNKAMLLTTLSQAYNNLRKAQLVKYLNEKNEEVAQEEYKKKFEELQAAEKEVVKTKVGKSIPQNLRMLPVASITGITDKLLEKVYASAIAATDKLDATAEQLKVKDKELFDYVQQAFIQAYITEVSAGGKTAGTPAADEEIAKFINDSIECAKFNADTQLLSKSEKENKKEKEAKCSLIDGGVESFFAPKLLEYRMTGKDSKGAIIADNAKKGKLITDFKLGRDPIALANKYVSDKINKNRKTLKSVITNAYAPNFSL